MSGDVFRAQSSMSQACGSFLRISSANPTPFGIHLKRDRCRLGSEVSTPCAGILPGRSVASVCGSFLRVRI